MPPQPASRLEKRNGNVRTESERSGQTRIGFTAWGLRESEKRNQAIGNSRESNVRESSETADSEYPSLVFTQIITWSYIAHIGVCLRKSGGSPSVGSTSNTMGHKNILGGGSINDDPGFRGNSNTSNTQQAASDTHESRVSPYLVTRDPSLKPTGAVTNAMDKDGLWCGRLWSSGKGCAMCNYDDNCGD